MSLKSASKKQTQVLVLGLLIAVFVFAALYQFVLVPAQAGADEQTKKREELRTQLARAQSTIRSETQREKSNKEYQASIQRQLTEDLPPPDNALAWASQFIQAHTRRLGLQVIAISEDTTGASVGWDQPDLAKRVFKPYAVRVELASGFETVRALVRSLQQANPYISLASVTVTADRQNVQNLGVLMVLEWPAWREAKQAQQFQRTATDAKPTKKES